MKRPDLEEWAKRNDSWNCHIDTINDLAKWGLQVEAEREEFKEQAKNEWAACHLAELRQHRLNKENELLAQRIIDLEAKVRKLQGG